MTVRMKVLVTGATGLIGGRLTRALLDSGNSVRTPTRSPKKATANIDSRAEIIEWDGLKLPPAALNGVDAIVHLAGESIFAGKWTPQMRTRIHDSRVTAAQGLASLVGQMAEGERPEVFIAASGVSVYGDKGETPIDEGSDLADGFIANVNRGSEKAVTSTEQFGTRAISLRMPVVLDRDAGGLPQMISGLRFGMGARMGNGNQWMPWIHIDDLIALIIWAIQNDTVRGPLNCTSPNPVRNRDFMSMLATAVNKTAFIGVPAFLLRLALGEVAAELLASQKVTPAFAMEHGFSFKYPDLGSALGSFNL